MQTTSEQRSSSRNFFTTSRAAITGSMYRTPCRSFRLNVNHNCITEREVQRRRALCFLKNRVSAAAESQKIIDRDDRVDLFRIDLLLFSILVEEFAAQEFSAVLFVPLKLNSRPRLRIFCHDLKQLRQLHSG